MSEQEFNNAVYIDDLRTAVGGGLSGEAEQQVIELFRRCFSRDDIAPEDDFFALGGDSLLATRLLTRLGEKCRADLPPDALFRYPTPRALARSITGSPQSAGTERSASLVPLNRGGSGLPVYLVHPTSANPWVYRPLVEQAQFSRPVFGTRAPDLDWDRDVLTMNEMVQHYATEIRRLQRRGPYALAGYSFGGNLAFEIANRLISDGQEVQHLVLFDTAGPLTAWGRMTSRERILTAIRRRLCQAGRPGALALDALGFKSAMRRVFLCFGAGPLTAHELRMIIRVSFPTYAKQHELRQMTFEELCNAIVGQFKPKLSSTAWEYLIRRAPSEDAVVLVKAHKVWAKNHWLWLRHRPKAVFPGTIIIYAAEGNPDVMRWQKFSSRLLDVRRVAVAREDHTSFLDPENVSLFAAKLKDDLEPAAA